MKTHNNFTDKAVWTVTFLSLFLVCARMMYMQSIQYIFIVWNLFLGLIPFFISRKANDWKNAVMPLKVLLFVSWLLFLPNSFYIITDIKHIDRLSGRMVWYDAIFLFTAALSGIFTGFVSLWQMERVVKVWNKKLVRWFSPVIILLSAFGVYLGRFDRWNSWDVVHQPWSLFSTIFSYVINPLENLKVWGVTAVFAIVLLCFYYIFRNFSMASQKNF